MDIYKYDKNRRPDSEFIPGEPSLLVPGNRARLLDGRRTPGVVERLFIEEAMFRFRIRAFEDKGKHWDLPAEDANILQFEQGACRLEENEVKRLTAAIERFQQRLLIPTQEGNYKVTKAEIKRRRTEVGAWLQANSRFILNGEELDLTSREGPTALGKDFLAFLDNKGLRFQEERTADNLVLNPNSGEWIKGMRIVMAEMGLAPFEDKVVRTKNVFCGEGTKARRREYLLWRLAFLQQVLSQKDITEVVLYRGMATEGDWQVSHSRSFISFTFSQDVARAHTHMKRESSFKNSYLIKRTLPINRLFMTYLETAAFNRQYKEAEALVFFAEDDCRLW